ncbi:hypothetical protein VNO77_22636 [Canavalia gladiata]|uniref:R13L1/DRL21-like LRR repeat region domain-containing protein n=1 Tax=Canavalia gladiata TaxID=3824 RepID=A0AAN9L348_CANGL
MRYRGTRFSDWMGHSSCYNMTDVILESCSNCYILPSLGELPYLKSLKILSFDTVESIGDEFYKNNNDAFLETTFPFLEKLRFGSMSCWEVWHSSESYAFPQLRYLIITDCPNLRGDLRHHLPVLKKLEIRKCPRLTDLPNQLPALETLEINGCEQLVSSLRMSNSSGLGLQEFSISLQPLFIKGCQLVESMVCALKNLTISRCPNFVWFPTQGLTEPNLTYFSLNECPMLMSLPTHMNTLLPKLQLLSIRDCPQINGFLQEGLPPNLDAFNILKCENLLMCLSLMGVHEGLTCLSIVDASSESVNSFSKEGLLPQLPSFSNLKLCAFETMETLNCNGILHLTSLQVLRIRSCPKLNNMVGERLPSSLLKLEISDTPLLEQQCNKIHPQNWHKISHIPSI